MVVLDFQIVIPRTNIPYVIKSHYAPVEHTVKTGNIIPAVVKFHFIFNTVLRRTSGNEGIKVL